MDRLSEIRARYTPGNTQFRDVGKCTINDIHYLMEEIGRLRGEVGRLIDLAGDWKDVADQYHAERNQLQAENRWIPVGERLPEKPYGCLVIVEQDDYWGEPREVMYPHFVGYDGEQWNDGDGEKIPLEVTHWRPLPEPPKGE